MNIVTAIHRVAADRPGRVAVRHDDRTLRYDELLHRGAQFAAFLIAEGVAPGERVGVFMHNQPEWLVAMLGTWQAGAVLVPFNYLFSPAAIRHAAADSEVRWIVVPARDSARLADAVAGLPVARRIIGVDGPGPDGLEWSAVLDAHPPLSTVVPRLDGDEALLMYTSGSTGTPKGVRQTHRNTLAVCEATIDWWSLGPDDHALVCTPLFHVGGLQLMALPLLLAGGEVTLRRWDARAWLDDVLRLHPTVVALVPAMMVDILQCLDGASRVLPSIRVCAIGGSALPQSRLAQLTEATGVVPVNIYGQTEQSGLAITEPMDRPRQEGSLGRPLDQIVRCRVVDPDTGAEVAPGIIGELWVRGDAVSPGYWQLPDVNAQKYTADGWFRTSDLVRVAEDGYFFYVERTDDMIISGGENIYPQTIEGHLAACPLIAEVTVIGTAHERLSQQVTAVIVPASATTTAEDIAAYCDGQPNLRGLQRPRRIELVGSIPRTATNKVDRPALRRQFP